MNQYLFSDIHCILLPLYITCKYCTYVPFVFIPLLKIKEVQKHCLSETVSWQQNIDHRLQSVKHPHFRQFQTFCFSFIFLSWFILLFFFAGGPSSLLSHMKNEDASAHNNFTTKSSLFTSKPEIFSPGYSHLSTDTMELSRPLGLFLLPQLPCESGLIKKNIYIPVYF